MADKVITVDRRDFLILLAAITLTGHSFLIIPVMLHFFFDYVAHFTEWDRDPFGRIILYPILYLYMAFRYLVTPFLWVMEEKAELIQGMRHNLWFRANNMLDLLA